MRARTSRLLLSVKLTRRLREGTGAGEGTDGGASWHGLSVDGGGDLRSVGHESQWGMPRTWREGRRVANAAEGETSKPPQSRSRRETALLKGSPCRRLCASVRHVFLLLRSVQRALSLSPHSFTPRATAGEPDYVRGVVEARKGVSPTREGCFREGCLCLRGKSARDRPSHEGSSWDNESLLVELVDSSCHVSIPTVTSRRTREFCDLDVPD